MHPVLEKILFAAIGVIVPALIGWLGAQIVKYRKLTKKEEDDIVKNTIVSTLSEGLQPIKTDISSLKTDVSNLKTDVGNIQTDIGKMKNEIKNLQNSEINFSTRLTPMQDEIEHIKDDISETILALEQLGLDFQDMRAAEELLAKETRSAWRYRIRQLCHVYLARGCMTGKEFDQLQKMYSIYEAIGGNGQTKDLYDRAKLLPIKSEEEVAYIEGQKK